MEQEKRFNITDDPCGVETFTNEGSKFLMSQNVNDVQISEITLQLMKCRAMLIDIRRFVGNEFECRLAKEHAIMKETLDVLKTVMDADHAVAKLIEVYSSNILSWTDYKFI